MNICKVNDIQGCCLMTHIPLDKMAAISQTIFSDAFSLMKNFVFCLKFHWSVLGSNWQLPSIGLDNGLVPNRRQAIIWPIHRHIYAALGGVELNIVNGVLCGRCPDVFKGCFEFRRNKLRRNGEIYMIHKHDGHSVIRRSEYMVHEYMATTNTILHNYVFKLCISLYIVGNKLN